MHPDPMTIPVSDARRRRRRRLDWATLAYASLNITGLCATTLLMSWGMLALFFLALGGFSVHGLMQQLGNLTSRYLAADAMRTASFDDELLVVHAFLTIAILLLRRERIFALTSNFGTRRHG